MKLWVGDSETDVSDGWTVEVPRARLFDFEAIRQALAEEGITPVGGIMAVEVDDNFNYISDITWE